MRKEKSRSPPKLSNGRFLLILACLPTTCKNTDSQGCEAFILPFMDRCLCVKIKSSTICSAVK